MNSRRTIIAFEGMPGAGKTTIIKILAKKLRGSAIVPQIELPALRRDDLIASKQYLNAEIRKTEAIRRLSKEHKLILVDRTFLTTLAYSYARSRCTGDPAPHRKLIEYFRWLDRSHRFPRPTRLFFLFVRIDQSIDRRIKYSRAKEFRRWFDFKFLKHFETFYCRRRFGFNMPYPIIIDTTDMSPKQVALAILNHL